MNVDAEFPFFIHNRRDFKIRDDGENLFIYEYKKGIITELNETARYIWMLIDKNETENMKELYADRYGITMAHAERDIFEVLDLLLETGILKHSESVKE